MRQVSLEQCSLMGGTVLAAVAEEDHRRSGVLAARKQGAEVGVGRDDDAVVGGGVVEDLLVGCCRHAELADVHGVVAGTVELLADG